MMRFQWDEHNWSKCNAHGVAKVDIEFAFSSEPMVRPDDAHSDEEPRFIAIGQARNARFVFIAFCIRAGAVRPISARYMRQREVETEYLRVQQQEKRGNAHVTSNKNEGGERQ